LIAHCRELCEIPRLVWISGPQMATIVWSIVVIDTARMVAMRTNRLDEVAMSIVPFTTRRLVR
jgi:hypothetical protein